MHKTLHIDELKKLLPQCLLPDQVRIGQRLAQALARSRGGSEEHLPLERWLAEARASIQTRHERAAVLSHLRYPAELPITARRDDIVAAIRAHPVVVVAGETGSGKTTQLPKMCLEAGLGRRGRIGCTQPRRVAALSISRRLAEELQVEWGHEVGCKIRFADHSRPQTSVKVMTDGILLAEVQGDPLLAEYDAILLDEAHERSLNIDFLLGYLKLLLQRRHDLKLVITSATIDTERFARAFDGAPVIEVSGRMFPVEVRYAPFDETAEEEGEFTYIDAAVSAVEAILEESCDGDVLVFMPGERDIRETCDLLRTRHEDYLDVVPLFGRLSSAEQQSVFAPGPRRRVVVATNVAETSLTVPRIRYVVDPGLARISRYHPGTRSKRLPVEKISQSSANQRKGRCGRVADGICIRLYAEPDFQARRPFIEPEIQRCDLADVILRMKAFRLGEIETFPFLDPPSPSAIAGAYQLLQELGALDEQRELTDLGRDLARLPVDPAIGRMILEAHHENALTEVLIIAAGLSIQDPRERPLEKRDAAEAAHRRFQHPQSDFLTLLNIWNAYHDQWEALKTQGQLRKFCKAHFLSFIRMREWVDIHAQLEEAVEELAARASRRREAQPEGGSPKAEGGRRSPNLASAVAKYAAIHRSILTGLFGHVAQREERNKYRLGGNKQAMVFPGSGLFEKVPIRGRGGEVGSGAPSSTHEPYPLTPPLSPSGGEGVRRTGEGDTSGFVPSIGSLSAQVGGSSKRRHPQPPWLVAGELMETSRLFLRIVAAMDPEWIIELAPHLVKTTHEHPHWDRESGRVVCVEKVLLRGLVLRERRVGYLRVNPADATTLFIRSALIEGDLDPTPYRFLEHNRQMREKVEMWQTRLPHRLVADLDEALFRFYAQRLQEAGSTHDLDRMLKTHEPSFLCATEADLLGEHARQFNPATFPDTLAVGGQSVFVKYAYAPGEERDGVTLRLSVPLAERVEPEQLDWLVPALREERVTQLLQRLPKTLRRSLMPLNHTAAAILAAVEPQSRSFLAEVSAFVKRRYDVEVPVSAWAVHELPTHLCPCFEIVDKADRPLVAGRDLRELRDRVRQLDTPEGVQAWQRAVLRWERYGLSAWNFGDLLERCLVTDAAGFPVYAYPGLQAEQGDINLRLFRKPEEAEQASRQAVPRLGERVLHRELNWLQKDLRALSQCAILHATLGPIEELIETAFESLCRHLLPEPDPLPRTPTAFGEYVERARQQLPGLALPFLGWVGAILQKRHEVLVCRRLSPNLKAELEALVPAQFLRHIPFARLAHVPRYVQGLLLRAERAALNPVKDAEKARRVQPYVEAARQLRATSITSPALRAQVEQFVWLVEEFKVSCFAQELGTATSVSAKRLEAALAEIRAALTK